MRKEKKLKEKGKGKKKVVQKAKQKEKEKKKLQKVRVQKAKKVELITASAGSYPRIGDTEELQKLRRAWAKRETGEISEEEFRNVQKEFIELAVREQEKAGVDIVTDGLITWYDQISHFAKNIQGVKINGLLRFFDTNTYFRQPVIDENTPEDPEISPVVLEDFKFAKTLTKKIVKPVLTGPITLAKLTKGDFSKALNIYTKLIENEVKILSDEGAQFIQIDEPALEGKDVDDVLPYLERIYQAKKPETKIIYFFYFRDFSKDIKKFWNIPADILGFDMTYSKLEDELSKSQIKKPLMLGVVDGRNTYIEKTKDVVPRIKKVLKNYPFDFIMISPSCGLEYLPRKFAFLKLKNMVKMVRNLR
jgi:5-methyltetrahydropteroyltriglutamate--homocysteine methyltransferase